MSVNESNSFDLLLGVERLHLLHLDINGDVLLLPQVVDLLPVTLDLGLTDRGAPAPALGGSSSAAGATSPCDAPANPVVRENCLPGAPSGEVCHAAPALLSALLTSSPLAGITMWAHAHGMVQLFHEGCLPVTEEEFRMLFKASGTRLMAGVATEDFSKDLEGMVPEEVDMGMKTG